MHEGAIVQAIIDSTLAAVRERQIAGRVNAVRVTVGVCQGLVPDAMQLFFDALKIGTPLADAVIEVTLQGMVAHCDACRADHQLAEPVLFCPTCGRPMELVKGKEILLTTIEVNE
jgi:hydrogenase nickel incorporation protein HypA/HybF